MIKIGVPLKYDYVQNVKERPIIYIFDSVRRAIQQSGADLELIVPIQDIDYLHTKNSEIPELSNEEKLRINKILNSCDGIFLPGGQKFTPFDIYILDYAIKNDIPTLGVCLSMQMMSCYKEEIKLEKIDSAINHHQGDKDGLCHNISIKEDSKLYEILQKKVIKVNSYHYYKASENHIYKTVAEAEDGVIEAIEHPTATFNIGLQWHPERDYQSNQDSKLIIDYFIMKAAENKKHKHRMQNQTVI